MKFIVISITLFFCDINYGGIFNFFFSNFYNWYCITKKIP